MRYMAPLPRGRGSIILQATVVSELWDIDSGLRNWYHLFVKDLNQYSLDSLTSPLKTEADQASETVWFVI